MKTFAKINMEDVNCLPRREREGAIAKAVVAANPEISDVDLGREIYSYRNPGADVDDSACLACVKVLRLDGKI